MQMQIYTYIYIYIRVLYLIVKTDRNIIIIETRTVFRYIFFRELKTLNYYRED